MSKIKEFWHWIFIVIAICISAYLRLIPPWNNVFVDWMNGARLSGNDPWYYFRLIENCMANFPNRLWFDAFTHYNYGTYTHFGPFLVYLGAILSKIVGASDSESIRNVIAFIPVIGGILLIFPTYLLAREVFDKKTAVIASLTIAMVPGQLLDRSILGFNDHHVWEVFWMISTLATFSYSLNKWNGENAIKNLKSKNIIFPIISGVCLGMYLDAWSPGFVIALLLLIFVFLSFLFKFWIEADLENLALIMVITMIVASIVYLPFAFKYPYFSTIYYSPFQPIVLLACAAITLLFYTIYKLELKGFFDKFGIKREYVFGTTVLVLGIGFLVFIYFISTDLFRLIFSIIRVIQPKGGSLTIAEVQPFFIQHGEFSLAPAWYHFATTFFFAIPGMIYTAYILFKERKSLHLLILLWGIAMFIALAGQNRFAYYFAAVASIFSALMLNVLLRKLRFYDAINVKEIQKIGQGRILISIFLIFLLFYPTLSAAYTQSKYAGGINKQWYDALVWMRNNTPNKEMYENFYYQIYKPWPKKEPYPYYPNGTYGVMSWWDYGHWITAIAHRIPNANPFQQGIGNKYNNVPGAAPFFTAFDESEANKIAEKLGVKYVVTDVEMATGKFYAMAVWAEGSLEKANQIYYNGVAYAYITQDGWLGIAKTIYELPRETIQYFGFSLPSLSYYKTMEAKLHIFDGSGLKHYRMVFESDFVGKNTWNGINEIIYKIVCRAYGYGNPPKGTTGYVKIFEYVKGAKITGKTNASIVKITTTIKTNQNRTFEYVQIAKVKNEKYEFIVPYAQETRYPVKPIKPYTIIAGNVTKTVVLSDEDVENGKTIVIDI